MSCSDAAIAGRSACGRRLAVCAALVATVCIPALRGADLAEGIRAISISAGSLGVPDASRRIVSTAVDGGYNTVFVPIPLDGGASGAAPEVIDDIIRDAHQRGLRVHASVRATVAAATGELPAGRDHVLYRHPEWLMVPRELALEMLGLDVRSPDYVGRLARWTRANAHRADGLYLSPLQPEAVDHIAAAVKALVTRYAVDGVHLESVRFPGADFDYSRGAMESFRAGIRPNLSPPERARLEEVQTIDPFGYVEELPDDWRRFRITRLTSLVTRLRATVRAVRPDALVSASVTPGVGRAADEFLQDWRTWLDNGFVDAVAGRGSSTTTLLSSYDALLDPPLAAPAAATASPAAAGSQ